LRGSLADDLRLSDIEAKFVCTVCSQRGADIRPDWTTAQARLEKRA
jgi:hypothetical protein